MHRPEGTSQILDRQLAPGAAAPSAYGQATPGVIRGAGRSTSQPQNCPRCHGRDGNGDTGLYLADEEGYPTRPRNLVWEEFKGGHDAPSVSVRIRLGLPGTPMAANPNLSEQELVALVHYCRSLAREPKWQLTNHQRAKLVLDRGFLSPGRAPRTMRARPRAPCRPPCSARARDGQCERRCGDSAGSRPCRDRGLLVRRG